MARSKKELGQTVLDVSSTEMLDHAKLETNVFPGPHQDKQDKNGTFSDVAMHMNTPMEEAGRDIIAKQMQKLEKAKRAVEQEQDPEGIHDMRVAIRRIQTALKILQETVGDPKPIKYYRKGLHKLMDKLSQVRDIDVHIKHLDKYKAEHSENEAGLLPLSLSLAQEHQTSLAALHKSLKKPKTQHLLQELDQFIKKSHTDSRVAGKDPNEVLPTLVRHFVGSQVWKSYEVVMAYETSLDEPGKVTVEMLHQLRIAIKKLRYTVEFFSGAMPPNVSGVIEQLTSLQDYLGDLHDHQVAAEESNAILTDQPHSTPLLEYRDIRANKRDQLKRDFPQRWAEINSTYFRHELSFLLE